MCRGDLVHARMHAGDWAGLEADWAALIADVRKGLPAARPFHMLSIPSTPADQLACARIWSAREVPARDPLWRGERYAHERIRLAYVCADFGTHPTAQLMVGLFEQHDRARFETIAVATRPSDGSAIRARLEPAFEHFIEAGDMADREIAALLREREVDIAIDLNAHITHARPGVFAMRPAPIQVSYLVYPGTSGVGAIDYLIADRIVLPDADRPHYSEKIVRLPETYFVTDNAGPAPETASRRADHGLPEDGFVFCCFNNGYKVTADVFDVWMGLLARGRGQRAVAARKQPDLFAPISGARPRRAAWRRRASSSRRAPMPKRIWHATAMPISSSTPSITTPTPPPATPCGWGCRWSPASGRPSPARVGASLLNAVGLPDLVTATTEAYAARALELATAPADACRASRARLAANRTTCPLFNTRRQTRQIEAAFEAMMARHRNGTPPEDFAVAPLP